MPVVKLDANFVLTATCPEGRQKIDYYDETIPGFILEVRATGSKTYSLRYKDSHGRQRQYKIGGSADLTFEKAKREATKIRSRVVVGENPAEVREVTRRIPTIAELGYPKLATEGWYGFYAPGKMSPGLIQSQFGNVGPGRGELS